VISAPANSIKNFIIIVSFMIPEYLHFNQISTSILQLPSVTFGTAAPNKFGSDAAGGTAEFRIPAGAEAADPADLPPVLPLAVSGHEYHMLSCLVTVFATACSFCRLIATNCHSCDASCTSRVAALKMMNCWPFL
jgi:hypothetical protein